MKIFSDEETDRIIQMYVDGGTVDSVARAMHCRTNSISKLLRDNGVTPKQGCIYSRNINNRYFSIIDDNFKAYFIGLLFTDGSVTDSDKSRSPNIRIELAEYDSSILNVFKEKLNIDNRIQYNKRDNRKFATKSLSIRSKELAEDLSKYGIVPSKTYLTNRLPPIPEEYITSFIHGLIDGDGSVYYSAGSWHINFCSHFKSICEDFQTICNSIIQKDNKMSIQVSDGVYRVTYNGKWAKALGRACFFGEEGIPRKRKLVEEMIKESDEDIVHSAVKAAV